MARVLISDIANHLGKKITIAGRVINLRTMGGITFAQIQDYTGTIQTVFEKAVPFKMGEAVSVTGTARQDERAKSGWEIAAEASEVISPLAKDLPLDLAKTKFELQLSTLLDLRPISLRHGKIQAIFKIYDLLLETYEKVMREEGFTEIKTPKILEAASEGGANFFKLKYFEKDAYLAQSPQLYKQIMVGVFERVFEIGPVFRAEPHFTTRHVNEYISLDAEMGFIENYKTVTAMLNKVFVKMFEHLKENGQKYFDLYDMTVPAVPKEIPHIKLSEIKKIIKEKYGYDVPKETDIDPEAERLACRYALEKFGSDFIFITHYPWKDRPFYTMPDPEDKNATYGFDLLFRGVEIVTGSQRIHEYKMLIENMEKKGVKSAGLEFYLDVFKYAMPPHGGWAIGSERLIQLLLRLTNVKEAVLFPRDVKRLSP
ncbi:MAG: aspartate--tRNA(Asn) ligase [Patescibacteria group bacterium]|jgi:nondiscriminating aspartyl-tRNA synthetase